MTPPMTPREKVESSLDDLLRKAVETMKSWTPEQREAHFEAQKKAWVAAEMAFGDEGTRVLTTLASGSADHADHSGGVTDMVDHAELCERLRDTYIRFNMGHREAPLRNPDGPLAADALEALLAENAALREDRDQWRIWYRKASAEINAQDDRATEAERKLAEAVGLLGDVVFVRKDNAGQSAEYMLSEVITKARTFLSKEDHR